MDVEDHYDEEISEEEEDDDFEEEEDDDEEDDDEEEIEYEELKHKKSTKNTTISSLDKLNVLYSDSEHIPSCIEKSENMVFILFTNFVASVPIVRHSNIEKNLTPCPEIDTSNVFLCQHVFGIKQDQVRCSDEISSVFHICIKCGYMKEK